MPTQTAKLSTSAASSRVISLAERGGYSPRQVVGILEEHLTRQLALCDALERMCDNLPDHVSADECLALAQTVYPTVHRAHQFEENVLYPLLQATATDHDTLGKTLDRLHGEHWEDESFAEEIAQTLRDFAPGREPQKAETLAYMVRGFFDGLRRHIAFEREHLMPMLAHVR